MSYCEYNDVLLMLLILFEKGYFDVLCLIVHRDPGCVNGVPVREAAVLNSYIYPLSNYHLSMHRM